MFEGIRQYFERNNQTNEQVPEYGLLYFDHLYSEYLALASRLDPDSNPQQISPYNEVPHIDLDSSPPQLTSDSEAPAIDPARRALLDGIQQKRNKGKLTWSDIYTFDLTLLDLLPPENLFRKAFSLRSKYRSIAGQREYDTYMASKPPDLVPLVTEDIASPPNEAKINELALRADIRYLLGEFHLLYSVMPVREDLRGEILFKTFKAMGVVIGPPLIWFIIANYSKSNLQPSTLVVVAFAGIVGGFVSVLQRIQSSPSEGDALFNLASLTHGTWGVALSPLSGAIFAMLLFILFSGSILQGVIFPKITTFKVETQPSANSNKPLGDNSATVPPEVRTPDEQAQAATNSSGKSGSTPQDQTLFKSFMDETHPVTGIDYALLIIWSFIAGFAERLVPDQLKRLVAKQEAVQGGST